MFMGLEEEIAYLRAHGDQNHGWLLRGVNGTNGLSLKYVGYS